MSKLLLAAYTTPQVGAPGYTWIWWHERLPSDLLGSMYSSVKKPTEVIGWSTEKIYGGLLSVDSSWCAVYRFLPAGRDARGRQGRFFLTAGFFKRSELPGFDLRRCLESPIFSIPLEIPPERREFDLPQTSELCQEDLIDQLRANSKLETTGSEKVNQLISACTVHFPTSDFVLNVEGEPADLSCSLSLFRWESEEAEVSTPAQVATEERSQPEPIALPPRPPSKPGLYPRRLKITTVSVATVVIITVISFALYHLLISQGDADQRLPFGFNPTAANPLSKATPVSGEGAEPEEALSTALSKWKTDNEIDNISIITIQPKRSDSLNKWECRIEGQRPATPSIWTRLWRWFAHLFR